MARKQVIKKDYEDKRTIKDCATSNNKIESKKMTKKFKSKKQKLLAQKRAIYQKILAHDDLNIKELALLVDKTTDAIKAWEYYEVIPKAKKKQTDSREQYWPRVYSPEDLFVVIDSLINHEWKRKTLNFIELRKLHKYLEAFIAVDTNDKFIEEKRQEAMNFFAFELEDD